MAGLLSNNLSQQLGRSGLSEKEASRRLRENGPNELPSARPLNGISILLRVMREPMLLLLVACSAIYLAIGDFREGIFLLFSVVLVFAISFYQERKAEHALQALRDLASPRALVVRDGVERRIPGREVVADDVIAVQEGDRVPADAVLFVATHLQTDESLLTGEAFSVQKIPLADAESGAAINAGAKIFSGTLVISGRGYASVVATGLRSEIGKIGSNLREDTENRSHLQREISALVRRFAVLGAGVSILITVVYGLSRGQWPQGILAGLAAAIALLPEEFPVVLTVFLALGAWRIAKKQVLTRKVSAIEALGTVSALCVDKTGTLTLNQMALQVLETEGGRCSLSGKTESAPSPELVRLLDLGARASRPDPFDPMEKAIHSAAAKNPFRGESEWLRSNLIREYPLTSDLFAMSCAWKFVNGEGYLIASKGAPEAIAELCGLSPGERDRWLLRVQALAKEGFRVLAVAEATFEGAILPVSSRDFNFRSVGMLAFEDPIRPGVPEAVAECQRAGIRVIMSTGDYPETARSIARKIGLASPERVLTGEDLRRMGDLELQTALQGTNVFARVVPDQKMRIINALKKMGAVVAMTGDGVNDAPALKWADIGIAMGLRGTDVAREASDLVLLNDDFSSIVESIRLGRRIFDNIRKALAFILAVHVPIAGMVMLPVFLHSPLVLLPAHIVFLELIIDPAFALVFEVEEEEKGVMNRPPRNLRVPMFDFRKILGTLLQGGVVLGAVFATYVVAVRAGKSEQMVRTITFLALVIANLGLILVYRAGPERFLSVLGRKNSAFYAVVVGEALLLVLLFLFPFSRELFAFELPGATEVGIALVAGLIPVGLIHAIQRIWGRDKI